MIFNDYRVLYSTFGEYVQQSQFYFRDKVNELERNLNTYIQKNIKSSENIKFLNPYKAVGVSKKTESERFSLLTEEEKYSLKRTCKQSN